MKRKTSHRFLVSKTGKLIPDEEIYKIVIVRKKCYRNLIRYEEWITWNRVMIMEYAKMLLEKLGKLYSVYVYQYQFKDDDKPKVIFKR
jgi:hypothetical protein